MPSGSRGNPNHVGSSRSGVNNNVDLGGIGNAISGAINKVVRPPAPTSPEAGGISIEFPDPNAGLMEMIEAQQRYAEQEQRRKEQLRNQRLGTAYDSALGRITGRFEDRGLDPSQYQGDITQYLDQLKSTVPIDDTSPGQYFSGDLTGTIIDQITNDRTQQYRSDLNQNFAPGFVDNYFDYNYGGDVIDQIIAQERGDVDQMLSNAYNRGNTTFQGYQSALDRLEDRTTGVRERVGDTARGVIEGYRGQLQDIGDTARQNLSTFRLGDTFNPSQFVNQLQDTYGNLQGSFEGDVRNTLGNTPLYDFDAILQRANAAQPASNDVSGNANVIAAIEERKKKEQERRGVGSSGVF